MIIGSAEETADAQRLNVICLISEFQPLNDALYIADTVWNCRKRKAMTFDVFVECLYFAIWHELSPAGVCSEAVLRPLAFRDAERPNRNPTQSVGSRTTRGLEVASGLYFLQFEAGKQKFVRRVILQK